MINELIKKYQNKLLVWVSPKNAYIHSDKFNYEYYINIKNNFEEILSDLEDLRKDIMMKDLTIEKLSNKSYIYGIK